MKAAKKNKSVKAKRSSGVTTRVKWTGGDWYTLGRGDEAHSHHYTYVGKDNCDRVVMFCSCGKTIAVDPEVVGSF